MTYLNVQQVLRYILLCNGKNYIYYMKNVIICLLLTSSITMLAQNTNTDTSKTDSVKRYVHPAFEKCDLVNGVKHGTYEYYYKDKLRMKGAYQNGNREGNWLFYGYDNQLYIEAMYKNDVLNGTYTLFRNGKTYVTGTYEKGKWTLNGQSNQSEAVKFPVSGESDEFYTLVEEMPLLELEDKSCIKLAKTEQKDCTNLNIQKYIATIRYPQIALENDIEGVVYIRFIVSQTGMIEEVQVVRGADKILNDASINHLSLMPNFYPGIQKGKPVKVQYVVPIRFQLN